MNSKTRPMTHSPMPVRTLRALPEDGHRGRDTHSGEQARREAGQGPRIKKDASHTHEELAQQASRGHIV